MPRLITLACLIALSAASPVLGQNRVLPFGSVALGVSHFPEQLLDACSGSNPLYAAEGRAGLRYASFSIEARTTAQTYFAQVMCPLDVPVLPDRIHTHARYPYDSEMLIGSDLRLGYRVVGPFVLGAGGGWLWSHEVPYALASAGLRAGRRLQVAVDVERQCLKLTEELTTLEWKDYMPIRTVSAHTEHRWYRGFGIRLGVELAP